MYIYIYIYTHTYIYIIPYNVSVWAIVCVMSMLVLCVPRCFAWLCVFLFQSSVCSSWKGCSCDIFQATCTTFQATCTTFQAAFVHFLSKLLLFISFVELMDTYLSCCSEYIMICSSNSSSSGSWPSPRGRSLPHTTLVYGIWPKFVLVWFQTLGRGLTTGREVLRKDSKSSLKVLLGTSSLADCLDSHSSDLESKDGFIINITECEILYWHSRVGVCPWIP